MPFNIGPKIHNVIPAPLRSLVDTFFSLVDWKGALYLTGGTCLAEYYFGHRLSKDMDLFTADKAIFADARKFMVDKASFRQGSIEEIRVTPYIAQFNYFHQGSKEPIKIDLVLDIAVHLASPLAVGPVWIDSLEDMLSNKMGCMVSRNEVKDYLDLFYLLPSSHLTAREAIELGRQKEGGIDPLILANQMEFIFHREPPDRALLGKTDWNEFQLFFQKFRKECLELIRP